MLGLVLLLHFGTFDLIALMWQALGVKAKPIMSAPLRSTSLAEFWGKRWNMGFRQLSYDLIFRPLHRPLGGQTASFLVFVASGLIHDLVISLPARGGYGLPTAYFLLQGAGIMVERARLGKRAGPGAGSARLAVHGSGCHRTCLFAFSPMVRAACDTSLHARDPRAMNNSLVERFFGYDLWLVGGAHFLVLCASFQVPYRLHWKEDLRPLMPLNRKLLWVQSGFTVLTIIAFGALTLVLHRELLRGDRAALGLACFIGLYWTARILVDASYFSHGDWPKGREFVVGHFLLTLLFLGSRRAT